MVNRKSAFTIHHLPFIRFSLVTCHLLLVTVLMRLDLFLKASRLVLRRTVAQEMCAAGAVLVNGAAARAARAVQVGDKISLRRQGRLLTVRVKALPAARQTSRSAAATLYEIVGDTPLSVDPLRD